MYICTCFDNQGLEILQEKVDLQEQRNLIIDQPPTLMID